MIGNDDANFSTAEIGIIVHATEDKDRVLEQLNCTLGVPPDSFTTRFAEGHWKNKILLLTAILGKSEANSLYMKVKSILDDKDGALLSNFYDEKGNLYIRLDKQRVCRRKATLSEGDSVRIKFKPILTHGPRKSTLNKRRTWC